MKRMRKKLILLLLTICIVFPCVNIGLENTAQAGTQSFVFPDETKPTRIDFQNGSFEDPVMPGWSTMWVSSEDYPGWDTVPINKSAYDEWRAFYFEIQRVSSDSYTGRANTEADGTQYDELYAAVESRIYQNVTTIPGTTLFWQVAHRARKYGDNSSGTGKDIANLYIRAAGNPGSTPGSTKLVASFEDDASEWGYYWGIYNVPAGQTNTEFALMHVYTAAGAGSSYGNYVDDIEFYTGAKLIAKKSIDTSAADDSTAIQGETVTVTVAVTNWGEGDASRCVFYDILSDGLEYVDGSAKINGTDAGTLATYNNTTDELRINFGINAASGTALRKGGRLRGYISMHEAGETGDSGETSILSFEAKVTGSPGYIVKNQARISYNHYHCASYFPNEVTSYSSVLGETPAADDETTYVNQFMIVDRALSGVAWYDANGDGAIDGDETRASGLTVGLFDSGDTNYTTLATDNDGNPLIAVTDSNGAYNFNGIPAGTYAAVITTPEGYDVTVLANDNDATADREFAVIGAIDLTNLGAITNKDFGFVQRNENTHLLILSKRVKGDLADPMDEFSFTITLDDVIGSLPYTGYSTIAEVSPPADGTISSGGTVTLRHGQQITISGVPEGTTYTITETGGSGYTTTIADDNASGTVTEDTEVEFVNTKNTVLPTSAALNNMPYLVILLLTGSVVSLLVIVSRNNRANQRRVSRRR